MVAGLFMIMMAVLHGPHEELMHEYCAIGCLLVGCMIAPAAAVIWLHHRMEIRHGLKCRSCLSPLTIENQKVTIRVTGCCGNCGKAVSTQGQRFVLVVDDMENPD